MAANSEKTVKRPRGKPFVSGASGNPSGRPKRTQEELDLIEACKAKTMDALGVIEQIMYSGENERNKLTAALSILERGWGKPSQPINADVAGSLTISWQPPA